MHVSPVTISRLQAALKGRVIEPDDTDYDQLRAVHYGGFDRRPAAIARVADAEDVAAVIAYARETGVELAVRNGGHSNAGHSVTEGGIVLDLRDLNAIDIDVEGRTAWAQSGVTAGAYTLAAEAHGLATGFGDTGSVAIGGITLGGGIGFLVRKRGMAIDHLLAAEIVTADGQILQVDADNHPDLFWAIRGGGGNFGVVTRLRYDLHQQGPIVGGMLILPATPEIIAGFVAEAGAAPEELSTIVNVMPAPPMPFLPEEMHGKLILLAFMAYSGDAENGDAVIAPFRALATPLFDMVQTMPYSGMFPPEEGPDQSTAVARTMFLDTVDLSVAQMIAEYLEASDAVMRAVQLRVLGGQMARVSNDATAFAHRDSHILANVAAFYESAEERPIREAWVDGFTDALEQTDKGAYVGFLADEDSSRVRSAYPDATWNRLRKIKAQYDPANLFRLNQNIPPATD
ncbi:FAD-binding oxidoreductase [Sphaerisporangium corydalis]|uniref:FAD-binding oxidoreductase n=1 Tax=Sphaerisporangium corydalis TaxID=1441875 RepID=A0ABV9EU11_9ACTN|nr:FAD-binding oxidoreductase [Sphaerisporangium corydalis]